MSLLSLSDPEISYDTEQRRDVLIRRVLFLSDTDDERCSMDPRPMNEIYPVSYIDGIHTCTTTGHQWMDRFEVRIEIPYETVDNIAHAAGRKDSITRDSKYSMCVNLSYVNWSSKTNFNSNVGNIPDTSGTVIEINGKLELYLRFIGCRAHNDATCYTGSHGKVWQLKGRFVSGEMDVVS